MKILNLYAGIGGNRKLWGDEHEITAVENNEKIAQIYQDFFPQDKVIVADAHQYLLDHYSEFDFIWSSPPCPSHSMFRKHFSMNVGAKPLFPDMQLYEEILFLKHYFKGNWVVENVKSYYEPLIKPQILQRHYFWANFDIPIKEFKKDRINLTGGRHETEKQQLDKLQEHHGFDISKYSGISKRTVMRNCVNPELGLHILQEAIGVSSNQHSSQTNMTLFEEK
jgi:DNA (cytosine-5)-methyltransferase 1